MLLRETQQLHRVAGQLNWVSTQTKTSNSSMKHATVRDLITAKKIVKVLRSNEVVLSLPRMNDVQNVSLLCFSDASFENGKYTDLKGKLLLFLQGRKGISLVFKKAKVISQKYFNYRNISFRRGIKLVIIFKTP